MIDDAAAKPKRESNYDFWAVQDASRKVWLGKYLVERSMAYVKHEPGIVTLFPTKEAAESAAKSAFLAALRSAPPARSSKAKTFAVARNGRNVRTISLPRS